jgi:hypothetical protein
MWEAVDPVEIGNMSVPNINFIFQLNAGQYSGKLLISPVTMPSSGSLSKIGHGRV